MPVSVGTGMARAAATEDPPSTLGAYTLLTKLATGGMATVYVGSKQGVAGFERLVAIKCCHPHLREDQEFVSMFLDEARLAARIHHPNVVATLDVGCTDVVYLVMEYVEGDSLVALLRFAAQQGIFLPLEIAVRIVTDALTGLHAAHELCGSDGQLLNLVHRDVSPQNILVGVDGVSRISDFGVAFAAARSTVTQDGRIKGKFSYMAPEQVRSHEATRRIDVFAAGIVLWEALTCRRLFRRKDDVATINAVLKGEIPAPSKLASGVPAALDAILFKALQRDPDQRYQTTAEFADALELLPIERATSRAVAAYMESVLDGVLAERRGRIRKASEQAEQIFGNESDGSDVHKKRIRADDNKEELLGAGLASSPDAGLNTLVDASPPLPAPGDAAEPALLSSAELVAAADDIEHRRMRGLLAAAMLLLVGSALGLLLARSSSSSVAPTPNATVTPTQAPSAPAVQPTPPR